MGRTLVTCVLLLAVGTATADDRQAAPARPLDLRPPDIMNLFGAKEIARILAKTYDDDIEGVEVRGHRVIEPTTTPDVWGGLAAPFWALAHPSQAWRIFAPLPPDQILRGNYDAPRATDTFVEPAAAMPATAPIGPP